jgi:hypothetical protein
MLLLQGSKPYRHNPNTSKLSLWTETLKLTDKITYTTSNPQQLHRHCLAGGRREKRERENIHIHIAISEPLYTLSKCEELRPATSNLIKWSW